jgi:CBS domain-containing protein/anti-sigma regulatory factor (Ser/Thr protein kinase)
VADNLEFTRTQELIYELPIERVMKKEVISVSPQTSILELKEVLRLNRISGVPVLEGRQLVGVISIADLIKSLERGELQARVGEKMTQGPITVKEKESVVEAVKKFARNKVGRLLVINEQGELKGILTSGDITQGLLRAISLDMEGEEIRRYRARQLFGDIVSDQTSLILRYRVTPRDFKKGGSASSKLKRTMNRLGARPEVMRRVAIASYEAEMNLVIHTDRGGDIEAEIRPGMVRLLVTDEGPGIADVDRAMSPGFSTAPHWIRDLGFGAGMGLANIKRCVDDLTLESTLGKGTRLEMFISLDQEEWTEHPGEEEVRKSWSTN